MEQLLNELLDIMKRKHDTYREFLDLIKKEREVIIRNKSEELQKLLTLQDGVLRKTSEQEEERIAVTGKLAAALGVAEKELTMKAIIARTDGDLKTRCESIYAEITETLKEIEKVNRINADLIKGSLDYIDFSLKALNKARDINPTYGESGHISGKPEDRKNFDTEA